MQASLTEIIVRCAKEGATLRIEPTIDRQAILFGLSRGESIIERYVTLEVIEHGNFDVLAFEIARSLNALPTNLYKQLTTLPAKA